MDCAKLWFVDHNDERVAGDWKQYLIDLFVVTYADHLFGLALFLIAETALLMTRRRRPLKRAVWIGGAVIFGLCTVYALLAARIYAELSSPLTYSLVYLAGGAKSFSSSLTALLDPGVAALLLGVPIVYVLVLLALNRFLQTPRRSIYGAILVCIAMAVLVQCRIARRIYREGWHDRAAHRLAINPHWAILLSTAEALVGRGAPRAYFFAADHDYFWVFAKGM
jgi:hypothetical protein